MSWPMPGDSAIVRARRVALAYRTALEAADPDRCAALDDRMRAWNQQWILPRERRYDLDEWVSAADAADIAGIGMSALRNARHRGRIVGRQHGPKDWRYRVGDILKLGANRRTREKKQLDIEGSA